jgi:MHS family proline/betaine transporter-like MFS transporter
MRMASGFSMGGEYAGTFVYLLENAPSGHRAITCSLANTMCAGGIFLASLVVSLVGLLPSPAVDAWGWRIPFFVGAAAGLLAMAMRAHMQESPLFDRVVASGQASRSPLSDAFQTVTRQIVAAFILASYIAITYHVLIAFIPGYLQTWCQLDHRSAEWIATAASLLNLPLMMLPAWLADRIGRKPVIAGAALSIMALAWPVFALISSGHALLGSLLAVPLAAAINAPAATLAVELFPTRVRFTGFAIGFNLGSIAGGVSPFLCAWLIRASGALVAPAFLVASVSLGMLAALRFVPETRDVELE